MALFGGGPDIQMGNPALARTIPAKQVGIHPAAGQPSIKPPTPNSYTVGSTAVRASGGIFDPSYNQALAGYGASAGGLAPQRGSNLLSFNPTSSDPFAGFGQPVGGGTAPLSGLPNTWLQNPAFRAPAFNQAPAAPAKAQPNPMGNISNWLKQWQLQRFGGGGGRFM